MKLDLAAPMIAIALSAALDTARAEHVECGNMNGEWGANESHETTSKAIVHHAVAVVHTVNRDNGTVSVVHEPVRSLNWPAMTKTFVVEDRRLFDKLIIGKKVCIEFEKRNSGYVITAVN